MSYSKRTHISAYHVYSSSQHSKSSRHKHSYSSDDSHTNNSEKHSAYLKKRKSSDGYSSHEVHRRREKSCSSDNDSHHKSYSGASFLKDRVTKKQEMLRSSTQRDGMHGRHFDGDKKHSAQSLLDINFSGTQNSSAPRSSLPRWKDLSTHQRISSDDESREHEYGDWKGGRRFNKYSDSEDDTDMWHNVNRSRRNWKNSSALSRPSEYPSQPAPLIIDMADISNSSAHRRLSGDSKSNPKPLLETYVPVPRKKPISLLNLPNAGGRNESRFKKSTYRTDHSSSERKSSVQISSSSDRKSEQGAKISVTTRKRTALEDIKEPTVKKSKMVKAKDKVAVVDSTRITVCQSGGHTFLIIPSIFSTLYLHGRAKFTVLLGNVSILGCKLRPGSVYDVYSPASGSLLALYAVDGSKFKASDVKEELSKFNIPENDRELDNIGNNTISVIMVDRLESTICDYVTSFIPYTQLFTAVPCRDIDASELRGITLSKLGLKVAPLKEMIPTCMKMSQEFESALNNWTKKLSGEGDAKPAPILLCCGAKNSGKSTFNRMLINTALKSVNAVAYLECDVGQTEFSPPTTLSLHVLKQPILGPPFCHQRHAEKMVFYGDTSAGYNPSLYVECLKFVIEAYRELKPQPPLVVNTMGFVEGVGLMLLIDTFHLVKPDLVVQIDSFNQVANLPALTPELVALQEGWTCNKTPVFSIFAQIFHTLSPLRETSDALIPAPKPTYHCVATVCVALSIPHTLFESSGLSNNRIQIHKPFRVSSCIKILEVCWIER